MEDRAVGIGPPVAPEGPASPRGLDAVAIDFHNDDRFGVGRRLARISPKGPATNELPQNSMPLPPPDDGISRPTRFTAATNTPLAMACARCTVTHASRCSAPRFDFSSGCQPMAVG